MGYTDTVVVISLRLSIVCADEVLVTAAPVVLSLGAAADGVCSKDDTVTTRTAGLAGGLLVDVVVLVLYIDATTTFEHGRQFEMT